MLPGLVLGGGEAAGGGGGTPPEFETQALTTPLAGRGSSGAWGSNSKGGERSLVLGRGETPDTAGPGRKEGGGAGAGGPSREGENPMRDHVQQQ